MINQISPETIEKIKNSSAYGLPDRPKERGMSPAEIKKAFYAPLVNAANSLVKEINRVVEEANKIIFAAEQGTDKNVKDAVSAAVAAKDSENAAKAALETILIIKAAMEALEVKLNATDAEIDEEREEIAAEQEAIIAALDEILELQDQMLNSDNVVRYEITGDDESGYAIQAEPAILDSEEE